MQIIGLHEINKDKANILNYDFRKDLLTFDDGMYSQYIYSNDIKNNNRIYFICPSLINTNNKQSDKFVTCFTAMAEHFNNGNNEFYMTINQIKDLMNKGYKIGAHSFSHRHIKYEINSSIINHYMANTKGSLLCVKDEEYIKNDTEKLIDWFKCNLNIIPTDYCYPFNQKTEKLENILKMYGFINFYDGVNRIMI